MHEILKSTLSVHPEHNVFTETSDSNDQWQQIASGFRFGSFFVIYGKFRGNFTNDRFMPTECDLYIQTFEGDITIGMAAISKTPIEMEFAYHPLIRDYVYVMRLELEALNSNNFIKQNPINVVNLTRAYPSLVNTRSTHAQSFSDGLPKMGNILVDMTFSDLSGITINNRNGSKALFLDNDANSPLINGDKFTREGSQLFSRKYTMQPSNDNLLNSFDFINLDFNTEAVAEIQNKLQRFSLFAPAWTSPIYIDPADGVVYGLGCHPHIVRIVF